MYISQLYFFMYLFSKGADLAGKISFYYTVHFFITTEVQFV